MRLPCPYPIPQGLPASVLLLFTPALSSLALMRHKIARHFAHRGYMHCSRVQGFTLAHPVSPLPAPWFDLTIIQGPSAAIPRCYATAVLTSGRSSLSISDALESSIMASTVGSVECSAQYCF